MSENDSNHPSSITTNGNGSANTIDHMNTNTTAPLSNRSLGDNSFFSGLQSPTSFKLGNRYFFTNDHGKNLDSAPRLVKRDLAYHQSKNQFNVKNKYGKHNREMNFHIFRYDWFHILLRWPTPLSLLFIIGLWLSFIMLFAGIYMIVDRNDPNADCGLGFNDYPIQFFGAFAFSLETCTTVGYGLPGDTMSFFNNCPSLQVAIFFQMMFSMFFNAFILSLLFTRFARCESRGYQLLFSDKAVIRRDESGRFLFEFKVYDADARYPVVEAHVRLYAVHSSSERNYVNLRLENPNDEFGAMLLTSIPSKVVHHIDLYSILIPPKFCGRQPNVISHCGMALREIDAYTGNREGFFCPVCGESYGTYKRLKKHIQFNRLQEKMCDYPVEGTHQELTKEQVIKLTEPESYDPKMTYDDFKTYFAQTGIELVAVVEGIDPIASGTFQALHSYQCDDIRFGEEFVSAWTSDNQVDFELFHKTIPEEVSGKL